MVDEKREATHRDDQELHPESVMIAIIGGFELGVDQVHCGICTPNVDNLYQKNMEHRLITHKQVGFKGWHEHFPTLQHVYGYNVCKLRADRRSAVCASSPSL